MGLANPCEMTRPQLPCPPFRPPIVDPCTPASMPVEKVKAYWSEWLDLQALNLIVVSSKCCV